MWLVRKLENDAERAKASLEHGTLKRLLDALFFSYLIYASVALHVI